MSQSHTELIASIEYHHKALNCCTQKFPYRTNIKSSLAEENAQLGHYHYQKFDYENAIKFYLAARKQDPDHFPALNQLAICYARIGRFDDALFHLQNIRDRAIKKHESVYKRDAIYNIDWVRHIRKQSDELLKVLLSYCSKNQWKEANAILPKLRSLTPMAPALLKAEEIIKNSIATTAFVSSHQTLFDNRNLAKLHIPSEIQETADFAL